MPVFPESLSIPLLSLTSQSTEGHLAAIIEGMDGNGKRKSLKVLFLPPVVSVTFSTFPVSQEEWRECPKLSSLSDCSDLQTTDAKCPPQLTREQFIGGMNPRHPSLIDKDLDKGLAILKM